MDINYIKEFVMLADMRNFLEASEALFISQSSLSKHIKQLEKELGAALFDRTTRKVSLTEYGATFLPYAKQISTLQYQYTTALLNKSSRIRQTISIGSIPVMAPYRITDSIMKFQIENSSFSVNLIEGESAQLKEMLRRDACELAFLREMDDSDEEFTKTPYTDDHLAAVLPIRHPLANAEYVNISQLKEENFLFLQPHSLLYELSTKACKDAGFSPNIVFAGKRAENITDLVGKGMGVSLLMRKPVEYLSNSRISIINVSPEIKTYIKIYYKKNAQLSLAARHFISCIQLPE